MTAQFVDLTNRQIHWAACESYFHHVNTFYEKLTVTVHVYGGQSGRSPELLSIYHRNIENGYCNIFIKNGMVALVTHYHKGFHLQNDIKIIY